MEKETVKLDLGPHVKIGIANRIAEAISSGGLESLEEMGQSMDLPGGWPFVEDEPTLSQLVVIAQRCSLRIRITNLELLPACTAEPAGENG